MNRSGPASHKREPPRESLTSRHAPLAALAIGAVVAGGLIPVLHQPLVALAHRLGATPWRAWSLAPTDPWGVPALVSAIGWGALWGILLVPLARRRPSLGWLTAGLLVALGTVGVGAAITLVRGPRAADAAEAARWLVAALAINGSWAVTAAWLALWLDARRGVISRRRAG